MKKGIHSRYEIAEVTCSCGNVIKTKTTAKKLDVEIVQPVTPSLPVPRKMVDTAGRIERFKKRYSLEK